MTGASSLLGLEHVSGPSWSRLYVLSPSRFHDGCNHPLHRHEARMLAGMRGVDVLACECHGVIAGHRARRLAYVMIIIGLKAAHCLTRFANSIKP